MEAEVDYEGLEGYGREFESYYKWEWKPLETLKQKKNMI